MSLVCPICKSPAQELPHTGHATGFECPAHGKFKVADTIVAEECTRQRWEAAHPPAMGSRTKEGKAQSEAVGSADGDE
jgi:hypothetical protein